MINPTDMVEDGCTVGDVVAGELKTVDGLGGVGANQARDPRDIPPEI